MSTQTKKKSVKTAQKTAAKPKAAPKAAATAKRSTSKVEPRRARFNDPLKSAELFAQLRDQGLKNKEIAEKCQVSIPAVYRYLALAGLPKTVKEQIQNKEIPASDVLAINDKLESGQSIVQAVHEAIAARKERASLIKGQTIRKMTVKSRLQVLQNRLSDQAKSNQTVGLLMDFAEQIRTGANIEQLEAFVVERTTA